MSLMIRAESISDIDAIRRVNQLAFGQDDEARLVDALRDGGHAVVSLVASIRGVIVGHLLFTNLSIITHDQSIPALALAPLAVLPEFQRRGIGSELVRLGLQRCREQGHKIVVVLGHTEFYPRFGFSADSAKPLLSAFSGEHWMAIELTPGALAGVRGKAKYAPPFGID